MPCFPWVTQQADFIPTPLLCLSLDGEGPFSLQTSHLELHPNPAYGADDPPGGCHIPTDFLTKYWGREGCVTWGVLHISVHQALSTAFLSDSNREADWELISVL